MEVFSHLSSLRYLFLQYNNISIIDTANHSQKGDFISSLEVVCPGSSLQDTETKSCSQTSTSLELLNLSFNQINMIRNKAFENICVVSVVDLRHNILNENMNIGSLKSVKKLYFDNNRIHLIREKMFAKCIHLVQLNCEDNNISSIEHNSFFNQQKLKFLYLTYNIMVAIDEMTFLGLTKLEVLNLSHNFIEYLHSHAFNNLEALKYLNLSNNSLMYVLNDTL